MLRTFRVISKHKRILHRAKLHSLHSNSHNNRTLRIISKHKCILHSNSNSNRNRTLRIISKHKCILHRAKLHSLLNSSNSNSNSHS